ncbi:MAG: carbohydrate-binding protein, partial [Acidobacteria bacterium]|nr:carbohydrate-binding protein [Acidobacteriota bacterium]
YRATDVDIERSSDNGGGYNVGWMSPGEWLKYSVTVGAAGTYALEFRLAAPATGGTFHLEVDGVDKTGSMAIPDTGGWQTWTTVMKPGVSLSAGQQVWRIVIDRAGSGVVGNLNYIRVAASTGGGTGTVGTTPFGGAPTPLPGVLQAERFDEGGFQDDTNGNTGGAYRSTDVDLQETSDADGGYNVGWVEGGEWLQYTVSVGAAGTYDLEFRVASPGSGGTFHLEVNGTNVTGTLSVPASGDWQSWTTVRTTGVGLAAGSQVWRLVFENSGSTGSVGNFNFIRAVATTAGPTQPSPGSTPGDIVLYASDVTTIAGNWSRESSFSGAGGQKMQSVDRGSANPDRPLADPADYFEAHVTPEADRVYRIWVRLRAGEDSKYNDSVWLQFSNAVTGSGSALWSIGSGEGLLVNLEPCSNCGVSLWGWAGAAWWTGDSPVVRFSGAGPQTVRVQIREDGVEVDQIVLSPVTYADRAPGASSGDTTIVPKR